MAPTLLVSLLRVLLYCNKIKQKNIRLGYLDELLSMRGGNNIFYWLLVIMMMSTLLVDILNAVMTSCSTLK